MRKLILFFLGIIGLQHIAISQYTEPTKKKDPYQNTHVFTYHPDTIYAHRFRADVTDSTKRRFWKAAGTFALLEALPQVYDRYIAKQDYAKISFKTIGDHFKFSSWTWDDDGFTENQFGHPYHGNLFFNAFRNNGYSYWESVPAAFLGSYIWETYAENQKPAPNDLINTTLGGFTLGEMTYRIAHKIINPHKKGKKRFFREAFATMINPVMGFSRLTDGQWGKYYDQPEYTDPAFVTGSLDVGLRRFNTNSNNALESGKNDFFIRAALNYVDSTASLKTPFREFYVRAELSNDDSAKINNVSVYGSLAAWDIGGDENSIQRLMITVNYDMFHNVAFYYGGQGLNVNWQTHHYLRKADISGILGIGGIALAAIPDDYLHYGEFRRYDYASGGSVVANGSLNLDKKFFASVVYRGAYLKTINGLKESSYFLNTYYVDAGYRIWKDLSINAEYANYSLHGMFKNYPDYVKKYPMLRVFVRYLIHQ
ncbi:DUF3943 domain-containing protein [Rhizosphaericola mali]|uniref:DUF3943 domain-containing protein n=1 Tax=Rhizosphaericola mali TaxID=2545455 RepID=A0A5P2G094_9BACT|nr:DUF3943 domain-containing protein [Rhizosphaericola mali]QES89216.1 DUF3943 domain-containing protein [Rhizosphaericola mali]